jgi:DNA replication and repair protein RecF
LSLLKLTIRGFRNLQPLELAVPPGAVLVLGPNGAGKSNLLEAVAVLGNLVSFRHAPPSAWVQRGGDGFALEATIERSGSPVQIGQSGRLAGRLLRSLHRGGRRLDAAEYLDLFPVATFSADDRQLVWGPPEERRRFLDRLAFQLHPETLPVLQRYRRALRQRNAILQGAAAEDQLTAFERDLSLLGARLSHLRLQVIAELEPALQEELGALAWSLPRLNLRYHYPDGELAGDPATSAARIAARLAKLRRAERTRGHTMVGPHRHDLQLAVSGQPARDTVSAGQGKLLATALKLAALRVVTRVRQMAPTVIFDDIDAELDADVLARVVARLSAARQLLLSSAHAELVARLVRADAIWQVANGVLTPAGPAGSPV